MRGGELCCIVDGDYMAVMQQRRAAAGREQQFSAAMKGQLKLFPSMAGESPDFADEE